MKPPQPAARQTRHQAVTDIAAMTTPGRFLVVGIGASAGGLDACRKLLDAMPDGSGMALIVVQHLDPNHPSMMADLLSGHTGMMVREAADGLPVESETVYLIPPGTYLAVDNGVLRLSQPLAHHGARLPFDFLLPSLATCYGTQAAAVVLSGTGADGSIGIRSIREHAGLVIAQHPGEAAYDGMPSNAIATGMVDAVLSLAEIPARLISYARSVDRSSEREPTPDQPPFEAIIAMVLGGTGHDFTPYKRGTLQRRIERRMALAAIDPGNLQAYLDILRGNAAELDLLAKDLLINVTSFFRDPEIFKTLEEQVIPDLIARHPQDLPIRIWVAGCSTGEEAYSLAMLFREALDRAKSQSQIQVFASDIDAEAVAAARAGLYPPTIEAEVTADRLGRFFIREGDRYRIVPELRSLVVFTVQDLLTDPPFSRLDFVSCRNLLIYLRPEAQAKVMSLCRFALRNGGILLLGTSETTGRADHGFSVISKKERIYQRDGPLMPGDLGFSIGIGDTLRLPPLRRPPDGPPRPASLAELCGRLVLHLYAPAAVLINTRRETLFSLGPIERFLKVPPGPPSHDLLAMVDPGVRARLRGAIQRATEGRGRVVVAGGTVETPSGSMAFDIEVRPVPEAGEAALLVCFIERQPDKPRAQGKTGEENAPRVVELEGELAATKTELLGVIRELERAGEDQRAVNEEALSINEEFQSTNEELLISKEELQSLNEELTALNGQLQETLERERNASNDLENVLYSTNVATLFLDPALNIRLFTPATRELFNILRGDIGRPLADLTGVAGIETLADDAAAVLQTAIPAAREIEAPAGRWLTRRILPYRNHDGGVDGIVVTFADVTEQKLAASALEAARQQAERATRAKSRFLAAVSHDLRQPLQTIALLQELLTETTSGIAALGLIQQIKQTTSMMAGMLNTLLDINQIEAGTVKVTVSTFAVDEILRDLHDEFHFQAEERNVQLRVVDSTVVIASDRALLKQMLRNLLSNAIKYTQSGRILLGCRRRHGGLSIEVWDTGVGIPEPEWTAIFDEHYQIDNPARERGRGLGLGLAIVRRVGELLGHPIELRSRMGRGSMFAVQVPLAPAVSAAAQAEAQTSRAVALVWRPKAILLIEDDPDLRRLLVQFLEGMGHRIEAVPDGPAAMARVATSDFRPDLILTDYNLPSGMSGTEAVTALRKRLDAPVASLILTGEISSETLAEIEQHGAVRLNKPILPGELAAAIRKIETGERSPPNPMHGEACVGIIDDDKPIRDSLSALLGKHGWQVAAYVSAEDFLRDGSQLSHACLLLDARLPGMSGIDLLKLLRKEANETPVIIMTGHGNVQQAVMALHAGAADFIEKPIAVADLLAGIDAAIELNSNQVRRAQARDDARQRLGMLTDRQREIMLRVLAGHPSKNIASDLGISQRTVEAHRAAIMKRTGVRSLPALTRLVLLTGMFHDKQA